jgi:hypothetical protein
MKTLLQTISKVLLSIPSLRKKSDNGFGGRFLNGGLEPAAHETYDVKFKSY